MTEKFDAHAAAKAIYAIMQQMGVRTDRPGRDCWVCYIEGDDHARIGLNNNAIMLSINEHGVSVQSSYSVWSSWSPRSKSFRVFKKKMGHILFYTK